MDHYEEDINETGFVIDDALSVIVLVQGLPSDSMAAKELQAAMVLMREARSRVARLVADARDEETSWAEIAHILGTGRLFAACRYGPFVRRRRTPLALD
jgi:hypothetical protein